MEKVWIKDGLFTVLTKELSDKLTEEEFAEYMEAKRKNEFDTFEKSIDEKLKGLLSKEELDTFKNDLKDKDYESKFKQYDEVFEKLSNSIQEKTPEKEDNFVTALKHSWDGMKTKFKENPDFKSATLTVKALPLTTATWTGSTNFPFLPEDLEAGIALEPRTPRTFLADVPTGAPMTGDGDTWTWVERSTIVDNTGTVSEGSAFGTVEVAFLKKESKVTKIGDYTKITREMLEDWGAFLEAVMDLIDTLNNERLNTELSAAIIAASVEFDANGIEVVVPNILDVLETAVNQIYVTGKTSVVPNKIYMHPNDVTALKLLKDATSHDYVFPPYLLPGGFPVAGITITKSTDVAEGYFEVCDMMKARKRMKRELELRIWEQNATDVQNDLLTITGSLRYAFRIKDVDKHAFVYDSFDAGIAIMTDAAAALAMILAMAPASDASKLTINLLIKAGVTGTDPADLGAYKVAIAAESTIADLAALQIIINGV